MTSILIIALFSFLAFYPTLKYKEVVDDNRRLQRGIKYKLKWDLDYLAEMFYGAGTVEPLWLDHLLTICLHTLSCVLIYVCFGSTPSSFIAAVIYCILPTNLQTSVWLNGRRYIINVILCLLIVTFKPWGILLYPLTPLFQINALLVPLYYLPEHWYLLFLIPAFPFLFRGRMMNVFKTRKAKYKSSCELQTIKPKKLIIMIKTYGHYFTRCLMPCNHAFYPEFIQYYAITKEGLKDAYAINKDFLRGVGCLFTISFLIVHYWSTPVAFGLGWWLLFTLQFTNAYTITQTAADRYMALPNVGLCLALGYLLQSSPILLCIILVYYSSVFCKAKTQYKDLEYFFKYQMFNHPEVAAPFLYYGKICFKRDSIYEGIINLKHGWAYNSKDFGYNLLMAKMFLRSRHIENFPEYFSYAVKEQNQQTYLSPEAIQESLDKTLEHYKKWEVLNGQVKRKVNQ